MVNTPSSINGQGVKLHIRRAYGYIEGSNCVKSMALLLGWSEP